MKYNDITKRGESKIYVLKFFCLSAKIFFIRGWCETEKEEEEEICILQNPLFPHVTLFKLKCWKRSDMCAYNSLCKMSKIDIEKGE